jgi:hypothetical protein
MKKLVFASALLLASASLLYLPSLRAQEITIKDTVEFNAYQTATALTDPKAKAAALEDFLVKYPQSVVKPAVLEILMDTYQGLKDSDHELAAANSLLQLDPANLKALLYSALIQKSKCTKPTDASTCDAAAALAQKGLAAAKPADTSDDDWKNMTAAAYPIFHSAIALDDSLAKKDFKGAEEEYSAELKLYTDDQSKSQGLLDTLELASAYSQPGPGQDLAQASWFFARAWNFAPASYKAQIEPKLEGCYRKAHGKLEGLDAIKTKAAASTFPPEGFAITPAPGAPK